MGSKTKRAASLEEAKDWSKQLASQDASERAVGAYALASLAKPPKDAITRLRQQIGKEKDEHTKASMILALGKVAAASGSRELTPLFVELAGTELERGKAPPTLVRVAAVLALAWSQPLRVSVAMVGLLSKNQKKKAPANKLPFRDGDLGALVREALAELANVDVEAVRRELQALMRAHPRKGSKTAKQWPKEVTSAWSALLFRVMQPLDGRKNDEPVPSELDAPQLAVLKLGVEHQLPMILIDQGLEFPMPPWTGGVETWRRYVGVDAPGPLDAVLTLRHGGKARSWPLWKWFRMLLRKKVDRDVLARELRKKLSAKELVELGRDMTTLVYAMYGEGYGKKPSLRARLVAELLGELGPKAEAPDLAGILHVLEWLGEGRMMKLEDRRWRGGPMEPKGSKKAAAPKKKTKKR